MKINNSINEKRFVVYDLAFIVLIVCQFILLMVHFEPAISTPDANGYFVQARLIAEHGQNWFKPESPLQYIGAHWLRTADNRYFCRYPPGLPIMLAIIYKIGGSDAALVFNPIITSLALLGLYLLAGFWLGKRGGFFATLLIAFNPIVITFALTQDAHAATAFFLVWGLYMLARWSKNNSLILAFFTGIVWGIIPTIRFAESIFLIALFAFIILNWKGEKKTYQSFIAVLVGVAIPVLLLFYYNHNAFGAFWKTGYSLSKEQTAFSLHYFFNNAIPYLRYFITSGAGVMGIIGIIGIIYLIVRRDFRRQGILFLLLVIPILLIYMAYYFSPEKHPHAMMRFLLPTFYVYAIAGAWLFSNLAKMRQKIMNITALIIIIVSVIWSLPQFLFPLRLFKKHNKGLVQITQMMNKNVEQGSIVIAPHIIQQHLDYIGKWRLANAALFQPTPARVPPEQADINHKMPDVLQMDGSQNMLDRFCEKDFDRLLPQVLADLKEWAEPDKEIYWIGKEPYGDE